MAEFNPLDPNAPALMDLSQQQKLADLLTQQGLQQPQGQMVSGQYVKASPLQYFANLANLYVGKKTGEEAAQKSAELAKAIRAAKSASEQSIINKMVGTAPQATELAGPYTGQVSMPIAVKEGTKPDLAAALREINAPENIYGAGKEYVPTILKQLNPDKPSSVLEFEYAKDHPELVPYLMNKAAAGASKNYLNVQNQLPFKEQIQKEAATGLMKNFETLQNIPATLQNMDKMVKLSQQPIFAGVGGESKLQIAKLLNNNFGTNISPDAVKNTEEFKAAAYMGIMDNLKKTDSNPTMAQQNALKEAIGSLGTDPSALPRVVNVMRDVLVNKAEQHNRLVQQTMQNGVQYPYSIEVQIPKTNPTTNTGLIGNIDTNSLDAILKARGAIK